MLNSMRPSLIYENFTRIDMNVIFPGSQLEDATPFERRIQTEELWLYRNPSAVSYVPSCILWLIVFAVPLTLLVAHYVFTREKTEFVQALMALSLALTLNGVITDIIKIVVGKIISIF